MDRHCLDDLLDIAQLSQLRFIARFGYDVLPTNSLYFSLIAGVYAELKIVFGNSFDDTLVRRCVFVTSNPDDYLDSGRILKSVSLTPTQADVDTLLETTDGETCKYGDASLWLGCGAYGKFHLGSRNLSQLEVFLNMGELVNPENGKVLWPRKMAKRKKVLDYVSRVFENKAKYSEDEVNKRLSLFHDDYALLRRELVVAGNLSRMKDGSSYWLSEEH